MLGSATITGYSTGVFLDLKKTEDDLNKADNIFKQDRETGDYSKSFVEYCSVLLNESEETYREIKRLLKNKITCFVI